MTPLLFLGIAVAGGVGAALRFFVDGLVRSRWPAGFPVGTALINVSGSLVLGFVAGLLGHGALPPGWELVLGTGLMGGYTTFSTASVESVRLIQARRYAAGALNLFGVLVLAVAAGALGLWLGGFV
ncbi:fluoride efflux transporter CrcB [Galbitalea soli]|uniref:Fluoride-specific ion channel FluC n=1 Tax=Galbitalea soli TaxID=1268042 RepID=A0A7C9TQ44_9MICO|nr:fluoride efflux transporter CrcB [Galbitalea soli]NEM90681.1 fluoride efflux transporter CrcB [Galbitalea soli]NYJ31399.1 CrcB protein [Galbitalea soli]